MFLKYIKVSHFTIASDLSMIKLDFKDTTDLSLKIIPTESRIIDFYFLSILYEFEQFRVGFGRF